MKHRRKGLEGGEGFVFLPVMDNYAQTLSRASSQAIGTIPPVQVCRLRRPQVVQVCVFGVHWRARQTHTLVQNDSLRRSRNLTGVLPLNLTLILLPICCASGCLPAREATGVLQARPLTVELRERLRISTVVSILSHGRELAGTRNPCHASQDVRPWPDIGSGDTAPCAAVKVLDLCRVCTRRRDTCLTYRVDVAG